MPEIFVVEFPGISLEVIKTAGLLISGFSIALGIAFFSAPRRSIEAQIKIYLCFNWKMEPLSWEREIRSTRVIGFLIAGIGVMAFVLA